MCSWKWFLIVLGLIGGNVVAQSREHPYAPFEKKGIVRMFGDQVRVREGAGLSYIVRATLPIGTEMQVLEQTMDWMAPVDYEEPWYKIKARSPEGKTVVGYVWGGLIADQSFKEDLDGDGEPEIVLIQNRTWNKCTMWEHEKWTSGLEIRVVKEELLWASTTVTETYVRDISLEPFIFPAESGGLQGFYLKYNWEECDKGVKKTFFLLRAGSLQSQYYWNEEIDRHEEFCNEGPVFPGESTGKPNSVVIYSTCTSKSDESQSYNSHTFYWDGRRFSIVRK